MDKKLIKDRLSKRFISEEKTPGISVTDKANKESGKINDAGLKDMKKDMSDYEKSLKQTDKDNGKMAINKYNYTDDAEKTYHDEMEILNGQEMIQYSREPGAEFKKRAEEAIEGSSRMGNAIGANAEETWGASSNDFGKNLVKRIKDSSKKRADAEIQTYGMGDVQIPTGNKVKVATTAVASKSPKGDVTKITQSASEKPKTKVVKENNNTQNKESMKRLKFNKNGDKPFKGVNLTQKLGHALTLIPESYKVDNKEFKMTDGDVTCKIRWEGSLTEGKAIVLLASDKTLIKEDMNRMKSLMNYKSQDTLGLVKGASRIEENTAFTDVWNKTKKMLTESEDIEDAKATEGDASDVISSAASEATKNIEGSVPTEKKTNAPEPKKGEWEKNVKGQASEVKKDIEGSVASEKKTEAKKPVEGEWDEANINQAPEAKEDVESGKPNAKATNKAKVVKENEEEDEEEVEDDFYKNDEEDSSSDEKEPSSTDIKKNDVPVDNDSDDEEDTVKVPKAPTSLPKLMKSTKTGDYYLLQNGKHLFKDESNHPIPVPAEFLDIAKKNPKLAVTKIQDSLLVDTAADDESLDEGLFGGSNKARDAKGLEFDQVNAKLVGTKGDQTANKEKWLDRAKSTDNYRGMFIIDRGVLQYKSKPLVPATGGSSGFGTANEEKK